MIVSRAHRQQVRNELISAGVTRYGLMKNEARYLPNIIHDGEHIEGVAYGRYKNGSAMLVATDKRVIFLDRKALITIFDELTYEVVAGVTVEMHGPFANVNLHTRLGDYAVRFVNQPCATRFVDFIERRRLQETSYVGPVESQTGSIMVESPPQAQVTIEPRALEFIQSHDLGVLSTIDRTGNLHGAAVYYIVRDQKLFILTKADTTKAHNVFAHRQIAFTVFDEARLQMVQLQGSAEVEPDQNIKADVFARMMQPRQYGDETRLPPVSSVQGGAFIVICITPTSAKFTDFKQGPSGI